MEQKRLEMEQTGDGNVKKIEMHRLEMEQTWVNEKSRLGPEIWWTEKLRDWKWTDWKD